MAMNTEQARDLLAEWARQGQEAAPPAWEELPGIPLYMDQVILYLGGKPGAVPAGGQQPAHQLYD